MRVRLKDLAPSSRATVVRVQNEARDAAFLARLMDAGLPQPMAEVRLITGRRFSWDFVWWQPRLALECQGGVYSGGAHGRSWGIVRDHAKANLIAALGFRTIYVQPDQLLKPATIEMIRKALAA